MLKAIIFDVDGVLIDDVDLIIDLYQETARVLGFRVPPRMEILKLLGKPLDVIIKITWPGKDVELVRSTYRKLLLDLNTKIPPVKGAVDSVKKLKEYGFKIGIVSSKRRFFIEKHLKEANFDLNLFDAIVSAEDTEKNKPDPEPLIYVCNRLNVKPEEAIYVGDTLVDFESAKRAEIKFIGVLSGGLDKKYFKERGVEDVLDSVAELPSFLKLNRSNQSL